mmetsp:Transcript_29452/g.77873  ORF Transcript_29452/g.77873 Transcript_29452/m.77873 type:complete len:220 (-) Transcript_29452:1070-1729(-)
MARFLHRLPLDDRRLLLWNEVGEAEELGLGWTFRACLVRLLFCTFKLNWCASLLHGIFYCLGKSWVRSVLDRWLLRCLLLAFHHCAIRRFRLVWRRARHLHQRIGDMVQEHHLGSEKELGNLTQRVCEQLILGERLQIRRSGSLPQLFQAGRSSGTNSSKQDLRQFWMHRLVHHSGMCHCSPVHTISGPEENVVQISPAKRKELFKGQGQSSGLQQLAK